MINPALLEFLSQLKENNDKAWFNERKAHYKELRAEFTDSLHDIAFEIARFDPEVARRVDDPTTVKVFRIYRDTRFGKNPDPLKTNISGYISAGGERPVYYFQVEPENSFAGGGLYMPPAPVLRAIREEIDETHSQLSALLQDETFQKMYPEGLDATHSLKTAPRGYSTEHEAIELLRLKSFAALRNFKDKELSQKRFKKKLVETFEAQYPLHRYLDKSLRRLDEYK